MAIKISNHQSFPTKSPGTSYTLHSVMIIDSTCICIMIILHCVICVPGQCKVTHVRECKDRGGIFHPELDSCNETNCLNDVCGLTGVGMANNDPLQPAGTQSWRLVLSLFIHLG